MKKSEAVFTTLLSGGMLAVALHHGSVYRDQYASRADCQADWSNTPASCEPVSGGGGSSGGSYYGPSYETGARPGSPHQELIQARPQISRSGFGHSGAHFSAGG